MDNGLIAIVSTLVESDCCILALPSPPTVMVNLCVDRLTMNTRAHIIIINTKAPIILCNIPCRYDLAIELGFIGSIAFEINSM